MRRSTILLSALILASTLSGCLSKRSRIVSATTTGQPCAETPEGAFVDSWREVQSEGFSFCLPTGWTADERYARIHRAREGSPYRIVSYAAPDGMQRVTFEVPGNAGSREKLKTVIDRCMPTSTPGVGPSYVGSSPVCVWLTSINLETPTVIEVRQQGALQRPANTAGADFRNTQVITYGSPYLRGWATGAPLAWTVLQTVRKSESSAAH